MRTGDSKRNKRHTDLVLLLLALLLATPAASAPVHFDAAWARSLQPGSVVQLPAGQYRGPWRLGSRVHLIAAPGAVLEGGNPVLTLGGDGVVLENLTVRVGGGAIGISGANIKAAKFINVQISGGLRGVELRGGSLDWNGGMVEQSSGYGIWVQGCELSLSHLAFRHHQGPALYVGSGSAVLTGLTITDAEYGLLIFQSKIDLAHSQLQQIRRTGAALIKTKGQVIDTELTGPFGEAAIESTGARSLLLRGNRIHVAGSMGIKLIDSDATFSNNEISGTRSDERGLEGDGISSNNSRLESKGDRLSDNAGVAIVVTGGRAVIRNCTIQGAGQAAAAVSSDGVLTLIECTISDGSTQLVSTPDSTLRIEDKE